MNIVDEEIYNTLKKYRNYYKSISITYYEAFKRIILLYYFHAHGSELAFKKDLYDYFRMANEEGWMDIVKDAIEKHEYLTTYFFPIKFLDPNKTDRNTFEYELVKYLKKEKYV
jgi:hypothetical protein